MTEVGLGVQTGAGRDGYQRLARRAEAGGVDVISVFNDLGYPPALPALYAMAAVTERVRLGPACLNPYTMHPHEIASHMAALDAAAGGRAYLGLARGAWLGRLGIDQSGAPQALADAAEVIGRLLEGDDRGYAGPVFSLAAGTRLVEAPGRRLPLLIGTWGRSTAAVAGGIAAEVKVGGSANPEMAALMRRYLEPGLAAAGPGRDEVGVVMGAVTVVDDDGDDARSRAAEMAALYLPVVADHDPTVAVDRPRLEEMAALVAAGRQRQAGRLVPPELLGRFAFAGTPAEVAAQAQAVYAAGARRVEFGSPYGLDPERGLELLLTRVVPALR